LLITPCTDSSKVSTILCFSPICLCLQSPPLSFSSHWKILSSSLTSCIPVSLLFLSSLSCLVWSLLDLTLIRRRQFSFLPPFLPSFLPSLEDLALSHLCSAVVYSLERAVFILSFRSPSLSLFLPFPNCNSVSVAWLVQRMKGG